MPLSEVLDQIAKFAEYDSFKEVIAKFVLEDKCGTIEEMKTQDIQETLDYNELMLLMGLWVKHVDRSRTFPNDQVDVVAGNVRRLLKELHEAFFEGSTPNLKADLAEIVNYKELFFYAPTHAYDLQYANLVSAKYREDADWVRNFTGLRIEDLAGYFYYVKRLLTDRLNDTRFVEHATAKGKLVRVFTVDRRRDGALFKIKGFPEFLEYFAISRNEIAKGELLDIGDYNHCRAKPILKLDENRYFIPSTYHLAEAMWERFFYQMGKSDYMPTALRHRGDFSERIVYCYAKSCFPNVYRNLLVFRNKAESITDIDVCAIHGETAVLFMVKSKKLTLLSRKGNIRDVYVNHKGAILSSFEQGQLARRHILDKDCFLRCGDQDVGDAVKEVKEILIYTVVLDDYPFLNFQSNVFLKHSPDAPISISIFDLEVILNYVTGPDDFVQYTRLRQSLMGKMQMASEMSFLEFYRTHREERFDNYDLVQLDNDWGQSLDADFYEKLLRGQTKAMVLPI